MSFIRIKKGALITLNPNYKASALPNLVIYVIPAKSEYIINTIFPIMTWLDLDSLGQNNQPSDWIFTNQLPLFVDQAIVTFSPIDCPSDQAIATFQVSDCQSQVYLSDCHFIPSDCPCVLTDITKRLPSLSKRLPRLPSDCLLCAVTKRLLLFGQAIGCWQRQILRFSWGFDTCPLPSLYIQTHELSLSLFSDH